jgi:hypothetical protein
MCKRKISSMPLNKTAMQNICQGPIRFRGECGTNMATGCWNSSTSGILQNDRFLVALPPLSNGTDIAHIPRSFHTFDLNIIKR